MAELSANGAVVSRFVYASKAHVPDYMVRGGVTYRIVSDHLGSVRLVVNATTGAVVQELAYDAFGQVLRDTNPGFQPFGFAGGLYERETGLVRFGARDYDPRTGRWTSKDPILFAGGSSNLYAYALEDPVNLIDVDGRQAIPLPGGGVLPAPFGPPGSNPFQPGAEILADWTRDYFAFNQQALEIAGAYCTLQAERARIKWDEVLGTILSWIGMGGPFERPTLPDPDPPPHHDESPPPPPVKKPDWLDFN